MFCLHKDIWSGYIIISCAFLPLSESNGITRLKKSHWHIEYKKYEDLSALPHHGVLL